MDALILELSNIGFTEYEAKAYNMLLQQNLQSASEIYKKTGIPRGRIYDILQQLLQKGFCYIVPGAVNKYTAVDPNIAINNLIEQQRKETKLREQKMVQTANILHERYTSMEDTSSPLDYIQVLTTRQSQINKFLALIKTSKKFICSFNKKPFAISSKMEEVIKISAPHVECIKRGIKVKALYEAEDDNAEYFTKELEYFESIGEEIRICEKLPMKMMISDNTTAMISLRNEGLAKFKLSSLVVEHTDLTTSLLELFDIYWEKAITLDEFIKNNNIKKKNKPLISQLN
ncbi:MAG: hypothetical protein KAS53_09895 [Candidatus Cloacimonetes bacterium]|nr:hypothetical protein [Candidatus Cloacimonadota bacterium]